MGDACALEESDRRMRREGLGLLLALGLGCGGAQGDGDDGGTTSVASTDAGTVASTDRGDEPTATTEAPDPTTGSSSPDGSTTEDPGQTDDTTSGPGPTCGDGMLDPGEDCDDGNTIDGDQCPSDCAFRPGTVLWHHSQAGGMGNDEFAYGITVDDEGRAYVAGDLFTVTRDFWVRQYEADGALGWTQVLDDGAGSNDGARSIVWDGNELYAVGYRVVAAQSNNIWIRSFATDGTPGWTASYNSAVSGSDVGTGVAVDRSGNVLASGVHAVIMQSSNIWGGKYSDAGDNLWTVNYGGPALLADQGTAIAADAMGNVIIVGFHVSGPNRDIWINKYSPGGAAVWPAPVIYAGAAGLDDEARGVAVDSMGNIVVCGFEADPVLPWRLWLAKLAPDGTELWLQPTWAGTQDEGAVAFAVAIDDLDDIVIVGQNRAAGLNQFLVRKYNPDGMERWTTLIDGVAGTSQTGRAVAIGPDGHIWVAGGLNLGVDGRDIYVARLSP